MTRTLLSSPLVVDALTQSTCSQHLLPLLGVALGLPLPHARPRVARCLVLTFTATHCFGVGLALSRAAVAWGLHCLTRSFLPVRRCLTGRAAECLAALHAANIVHCALDAGEEFT